MFFFRFPKFPEILRPHRTANALPRVALLGEDETQMVAIIDAELQV